MRGRRFGWLIGIGGGDMCGHAEVGRGLERLYVWVGLG
jgi:hypothetical protein